MYNHGEDELHGTPTPVVALTVLNMWLHGFMDYGDYYQICCKWIMDMIV